MGLSEFLSRVFSGEGPADDGGVPASAPSPSSSDGVVYECRKCGETVSESAERCPACDAAAIAEYPIE